MKEQEGKIVIFDWGGVTEIPEDLLRCKVNFVRRFNDAISVGEVTEKFDYVTEDGKSVIAGDLPEERESWIRLIEKNFGFDASREEFEKVYLEEFRDVAFHKAVTVFARSLRERCQNGILSNLIGLDAERCDRQYHLDAFDHVYFSFALRTEKPNDDIFEYIEKDLGFAPENIMLIDDNGDNIATARRRGWATCQATGYELEKMKFTVDEFLKH